MSNNLAAFGKLERVLGELNDLPRRLAIAAAPGITKELKKEFSSGADPYGRRWKKLKSGKPSHLTKSRKLRNGTRAAPMPGNRKGIRIILGAKYAIYHQTGTYKMPARKILPERGMPAAWRMILQREARNLLKRVK